MLETPSSRVLVSLTTFPIDIKDFICSRRYESLTLHGVLQGIKHSSMAWTEAPTKPSKMPQTTVSDTLKRRELMEEFMYWYFDSFLMPLLKVHYLKRSSHEPTYRIYRQLSIAPSLQLIETEFFSFARMTGSTYVNLFLIGYARLPFKSYPRLVFDGG